MKNMKLKQIFVLLGVALLLMNSQSKYNTASFVNTAHKEQDTLKRDNKRALWVWRVIEKDWGIVDTDNPLS